jgi:SOS-response transcriptional repressor LexA
MGKILGYRGRQVLEYVTSAIEAEQRSPSYAMIADALGMNSIADVCNVVRRLEQRGYLQRRDTGTRHRKGWHNPVIVVVR